jgi:hypothetical protein
MSVRRAAHFHGLELEALLRDLNETARDAARGDAAARPGTRDVS